LKIGLCLINSSEDKFDEQKDLNLNCDIENKINAGRKRISILKDVAQSSNFMQIVGNARKSIIKINGTLSYFIKFFKS